MTTINSSYAELLKLIDLNHSKQVKWVEYCNDYDLRLFQEIHMSLIISVLPIEIAYQYYDTEVICRVIRPIYSCYEPIFYFRMLINIVNKNQFIFILLPLFI